VKATRQIKRIRFTGAQNRVGMIYDILKAVGKYGINVLNIEVNPPHIYFKVEWPQELAWHPLVSRLSKEVRGIGELVEVDIMEYEKKEKALDIIGDNISEGILVVDQSGHITYSSKKAREILGISPGEQPNLSSLLRSRQLEPRLPVDEDRDNVEVSITWQGKSTRVVTSIRTITNEEGIPAGALIIFRELDDVRQLIQSVSGPALVDFDDIIGNSQVFTNAINLAKTVAPTNMSVMLRGESGTGKELFARAIHKNSARTKGPFVAVNCAAIPDSLLESEFFGYERGAFTGASPGGKQGLFELATHGSLFLDEVGDLSPPLQAKILRAIQEQRIRRVGGRQEIKIDIRIISATNKDLETMVSEGTFREDLFYRLNVIPIWIPPLSDRKEDIPILARHFLNTLARELGKPELSLTEDAENKLTRHKWPGNVRELQNVIQRAAVLSNNKVDSTSLIIEGLSSPPLEYGSPRPERTAAGPGPLSDSQAGSPERLWETFPDRLAKILPEGLPVDLPGLIQKIEKHCLKQACSQFSSSREIGNFLGISHTAAINKMKRFGIRS
jgi:TyrR family helix-turn-helix protein